MTNTYKDNAPIDEKAKEELRLIRCLAERLLRCLNESMFVDYQMEKFGDKFKGDTHSDPESTLWEQYECANCGQMRKSHYGYFKCQPDGKTEFKPMQSIPDVQDIRTAAEIIKDIQNDPEAMEQARKLADGDDTLCEKKNFWNKLKDMPFIHVNDRLVESQDKNVEDTKEVIKK